MKKKNFKLYIILYTIDCPNGWIDGGNLNRCFLFGSNNLKWSDAIEFCDTKGGYLIDIPNKEIETFVEGVVEIQGETKRWWINANDLENVKYPYLNYKYPTFNMSLFSQSYRIMLCEMELCNFL